MPLIANVLRKGLVVLGLACIITVLLAITSSDQWWMRAFDYPRLQITILSIVVCLLSFIFLDWRKRWLQTYLFLLLAAVIWQGYILHPYFLPIQPTVPDREATNPQRTFSLLVSNVLMENREVQSYLDLVQKSKPDVVLVIEPDAWWTEQLAPLRMQYQYFVEQPQDNHYGMNLYSTFPLSEQEIYHLEATGTPAIYAVLTLPAGDELEFYGVHPRPPLPENSVSAADKELIKIAQLASTAERPVVVAGDFNDVPWSFTLGKFQEISRLRDIRAGRGFYNTFDAKNPILRLPIDHVFISPRLGLVELANPIAYSSDHMALFVTLLVDESVE